MTLSFLLTTLIVVASPSTGVLYTLAVALTQGARPSLAAAFGCTLGIVPHLIAAVMGLAAVLHASAVAFQTLKYLGVTYLLYLSWATLRDKSELMAADAAEPSAPRVIASGVLINLLNPKLTIFFFAFLPQFVDTGPARSVPRMLELSGVFMLVTFVIFAGYGAFAATVREHVISRPAVVRWLRRGFAGSYAVLAGRLALPDR